MPSPWVLPACVCTEGAAPKTTSFLRTQIRMRASCVKLRLWTVPRHRYIMTHSLTEGQVARGSIDPQVLDFVVQSLSRVRLFVTPRTAEHQASLSFTISQSLLKLMSIESLLPSNHLILSRPLLFLSSIFPSFRIFSNESVLRIRWPECWSFSFTISPSNEYSGLTSFRMDWLDLLAVQGTLKSLLQHHSSKASIRSSVLSFLYSPTLTSIHDHWKNHSFD